MDRIEVEWDMPKGVPSLKPHRVHVWAGALDLSEKRLVACEDVLARDERDRASRFLRASDRHRFVAGRGILRHLLAQYVGAPAGQLDFAYGPNGKPRLADIPMGFNVSHSQGMGAWAFAAHGAVGVDVEWMGRKVALNRIARRFLSDGECAALREVDESRRPACFFQCWTRKEAFVKAIGDGLTFPLNAFDVTVDGPAELLRVEGDPSPDAWALEAFEPAPAYAGAVAFRGAAQVQYFATNEQALGF